MGSNPIQVASLFSGYAFVAQLVEQRTENPRVVGSIPTGGTIPRRFSCGGPKCECSSSGRAPPCQGGGSEFEPRNPLHSLGKYSWRLSILRLLSWDFFISLYFFEKKLGKNSAFSKSGQKNRNPEVFRYFSHICHFTKFKSVAISTLL